MDGDRSGLDRGLLAERQLLDALELEILERNILEKAATGRAGEHHRIEGSGQADRGHQLPVQDQVAFRVTVQPDIEVDDGVDIQVGRLWPSRGVRGSYTDLYAADRRVPWLRRVAEDDIVERHPPVGAEGIHDRRQ